MVVNNDIELKSVADEVKTLLNKYVDLYKAIEKIEESFKEWKKNLINIINIVANENDIERFYIVIKTDLLTLKLTGGKGKQTLVSTSLSKKYDFYDTYNIPYIAKHIIGNKRTIKHAIAVAYNIEAIKKELEKLIEQYKNTEDRIKPIIETIDNLLSFAKIASNI